jgi:hypothetical protein
MSTNSSDSMSDSVVALSVGVTALIAADLAALIAIRSLYMQRHNMLVRARSPKIALLQGGMCLLLLNLIVIQEIMRQLDTSSAFPCGLLLWASAFACPLISETLFLRALRVVVMTDAECRLEDTGLISPKGSVRHLSRVGLVSLCIALYYHIMATHDDIEREYCYVFQPWPLFLGEAASTLTYLTNSCVTVVFLTFCLQYNLKRAVRVLRSSVHSSLKRQAVRTNLHTSLHTH